MKRRWQKVASTVVHDQAPFFHVTSDEVIAPDGRRTTYGVIHGLNVVMVIIRTTDHKFALIREYRYPIDAEILQFVAGGVEPGEDVVERVKLEAREEVGLKDVPLELIGRYYSNPARTPAVVHVFVAQGVDPTSLSLAQQEGNEAINDIVFLSDTELLELGRRGELDSSGTLSALNLYWMKYGFPTGD